MYESITLDSYANDTIKETANENQKSAKKPKAIITYKDYKVIVFSTGVTLVGVLQNWLKWSHFLFLEGGLLVILIDCMIFQSPFLMLQGYLCQQFLSLHS